MDTEADTTTVHITSYKSFFARYVDHPPHDVNASHHTPISKAYADIDDVTSPQMRQKATTTCCPAKSVKRMFGCPLCRYATDRKNNLKRHLLTMHRERTVEFAPVETTKMIKNCSSMVFASRKQQQRRSINDDDDCTGYRCIRCNTAAESYRSNSVQVPGERSRPDESLTRLTDHYQRTDDNHATTDEQRFGVSCDLYDEDFLENSRHLLTDRLGPVCLWSAKTADATESSGRVAAADFGGVDGAGTPDGSARDSTSGYDRRLDDSWERFEPRAVLAYRRPSSRMFFYNRLTSTHERRERAQDK